MGLTGDDLTLAIQTASTERRALLEEFLYEGDIMMLSAEAGAGKSLIATQLVCQLTCGQRTFDFFNVPSPRRIYYLQLEGEPEEAYERMQRMGIKIGRNSTNLYWESRPTGIDLQDRLQVETLLKEIAAWGKPDLVVIDPLYQAVYGELAKEMPSKAIIRFLGALRTIFKPCAVLVLHHTKKPALNVKTGKEMVVDDPYFGSTWLKAFVNTSFLLRSGGGRYAGSQTMLICKKSRGSDVIKDLILHYEPETGTVTADAPFEEQSGYERVSKYLDKLKKSDMVTNFFEVRDVCKLSDRQLRYVQIALIRTGRLKCDKSKQHIKIWEPQ